MRRKQILGERHDAMLGRLVDLADSARNYAGEQNDYQRNQRLRNLAERALRYAASVRTLARKS